MVKRIIFGTYDVFAPVILWSIIKKNTDRKMAQSKQVVITKNQFFHSHQPREENFEIHSH